MPQDRIDGRETRRIKLALGAALAAIVACGPLAAHAGDSDGTTESFTDKFMRTLGLKDPNNTEYEINYSERSPLVVPPTRDLPPPATARVAPTPNWPKDPDTMRHQTAKEDDKPVVRPYDSVMESSRPLRPDELKVRASPAIPSPGVGEQSTPAQLGEPKKSFFDFNWMNKEQYATFTGEPPRANLTDPPPGYLTPSPDQPYGITPEKKSVKPKTLGERMEPVR